MACLTNDAESSVRLGRVIRVNRGGHTALGSVISIRSAAMRRPWFCKALLKCRQILRGDRLLEAKIRRQNTRWGKQALAAIPQ